MGHRKRSPHNNKPKTFVQYISALPGAISRCHEKWGGRHTAFRCEECNMAESRCVLMFFGILRYHHRIFTRIRIAAWCVVILAGLVSSGSFTFFVRLTDFFRSASACWTTATTGSSYCLPTLSFYCKSTVAVRN